MNAITKNRAVPDCVRFTETGLEWTRIPTEEEHGAVGIILGTMERAGPWQIGDWYNTIPRKDGRWNTEECKKAACEKYRVNYKTAKTCGWVAEKFKVSTRIDTLTFTHYRNLAIDDLDDVSRQELIKQAIAEKLSVKQLKIERDKLMGTYIAPLPKPTNVNEAINQATQGVPKKYVKQVQKATTDIIEQLHDDFDKALVERVSIATERERNNLLKEEAELKSRQEHLAKTQRKVNLIMTKSEFKLVRSCLHPDRHPEEKKKYDKAFTIFNRLLESIDPATRKEWES